ncbi:fungal-specific transcription factor domain-containing protein [Peziza echinospora]|nr:fungal-specific transcription factor domain-containing protein [Peziza echinospora]
MEIGLRFRTLKQEGDYHKASHHYISPGSSPAAFPACFHTPPASETSPYLSSVTFSSNSSVSSGPNSPLQSIHSHPNTPSDQIFPKIEEIEESCTHDRKPTPPPQQTTEIAVRRGRGRPRKALPPTGSEVKAPKVGRTKTGCITCRKRKKKCDEEKPECKNCLKNSLYCEGYPDRVLWQSGKQKIEAQLTIPNDVRQAIEFHNTQMLTVVDLPNLIDGVETSDDRLLLDHFIFNISRVLTLINDETNPFQEFIVPAAVQHRGLMHSLLCLSAAHLNVKGQQNFKVPWCYHFDKALQFLRKDSSIVNQSPTANDPAIAQMLIFCLTSICLGHTDGEYRPHMDAGMKWLDQCQTDTPYGKFLFEIFMYHDVANSITSLDRRPSRALTDYRLPGFILQPEAGVLLGVLDGLFIYLSKITILRDAVRDRRNRNIYPRIDYEMLSTAVAIDSDIRSWVPPNYPNSHRYIAAQLYRQSTWVYLYRTIQPSKPGSKIRRAVDTGLAHIQMLPQDSATQGIMLMPLFILGCAAFDPGQRPAIRERFESLYKYSGLKNIQAAFEAVERIWLLMDAGDDKSWDWEAILHDMGYDFLVT